MLPLILLAFLHVSHSQNCVTKCYYTNETLTAGGPHTCLDDCDCWSVRTCSTHNWCQGNDTYHVPPDCGTTKSPTPSPTNNPTPSPTANPAPAPTTNPTPAPTTDPTPSPTSNPTPTPTFNPTHSPTNNPTHSPTLNPTPSPTSNPTPAPTSNPTHSHTLNPTPSPTSNPTHLPTQNPIKTDTNNPTNSPTLFPTNIPSKNPTLLPTKGGESNEQRDETTTYIKATQDELHSNKQSNLFSDGYLVSNWYLLAGIVFTLLCCLCIITACIMFNIQKKKRQKQNVRNNETCTPSEGQTHSNQTALDMKRVISMSVGSTSGTTGHSGFINHNNDIEMIQTPNSLSIQPMNIIPVMITPMQLKNNSGENILPLSLNNNNNNSLGMNEKHYMSSNNEEIKNNYVTKGNFNEDIGMGNDMNVISRKHVQQENNAENDEEYEYYYEDENDDGSEELYASNPNQDVNVENEMITPQ